MSGPQLNVTIKQQGQVCVLSVSGELDIATAPILARQAAVLPGRAERLIMDLSGLQFVDCSGAQALAAVTSAAPPGCPVLVRGLARRIRQVFDILALPLERPGEVKLDDAQWVKLEAQVLRAWARQARADELTLVVHELAANAVRHGAGHGRLLMWHHDGTLHCRVDDDGPPGRAGQHPGCPARNQAAGWPRAQPHGLWLVRALADQVTITSGGAGTRAVVAFALPAPA